MSPSRFRAQPRKGHLDRAKRIVGYLLFLPDGAIRFRTGEPDFSSLKDQEYDWTRSVYSGACAQIPHDIPKPLGKHVQTTHYVDANLHHDLATGKAFTAVLHFLNQTPIDAYTKRQSTVETATYGSEFVAARTAVDKIIDIRTTLRYLGVPIIDRIASTTPGAEPPRDARDSGSSRSHSTHLETSSSDRPKWSPTRRSTRYQDQISVKCTRQTLRMPSFTRAAHAQPTLSNFPRRDSNFGERTRSCGTTLGEHNFPTSPQNKITKLTHCSIFVTMRTISTPQTK